MREENHAREKSSSTSFFPHSPDTLVDPIPIAEKVAHSKTKVILMSWRFFYSASAQSNR